VQTPRNEATLGNKLYYITNLDFFHEKQPYFSTNLVSESADIDLSCLDGACYCLQQRIFLHQVN
jgi:hypothetical protein